VSGFFGGFLLLCPFPVFRPFRVNAETGAVEEEYTSNVVSQLKVFDSIGAAWADPAERIAVTTAALPVGEGASKAAVAPTPGVTMLPRAEAYERARAIAKAWQQAVPEQNGAWTACCEDVPIDNSLTNFNSIQVHYSSLFNNFWTFGTTRW